MKSVKMRMRLYDGINVKSQQVGGRKCFTEEKINLYMLEVKGGMCL